jgi:putative membrane protein
VPTSDETSDATRRTWLASERTWLAWVRTGFTATAVAVGIGRIVPELSDVTRWPFAVVGLGYGILGVGIVVYGLVRRREVEAALARGEYAPAGETALLVFVTFAAVLGIASGALILVS